MDKTNREILANAGVRVQENMEFSIYPAKTFGVRQGLLPFTHSGGGLRLPLML